MIVRRLDMTFRSNRRQNLGVRFTTSGILSFHIEWSERVKGKFFRFPVFPVRFQGYDFEITIVNRLRVRSYENLSEVRNPYFRRVEIVFTRLPSLPFCPVREDVLDGEMDLSREDT